MSPDGRFVAFSSSAALDPSVSDTNNANDVFRRDMDSGTIKAVSVVATGSATPSTASRVAGISADGRHVVFTSAATTLSPLADTNASPDVFRRDMTRGATTLLSASADALAASTNGIDDGYGPVSTPDGRFVFFQSASTNLVAPFTDGNSASNDLYARGNRPPVSAFTATPLTGTAPLEVSFASSASDPDGTVVSQLWGFGDGATATSASTSHSYAAGAYTAKLTVSDNSGESVESTQGITATQPEGSPSTSNQGEPPAPSIPPVSSADTTAVIPLADLKAPVVVLGGKLTQRSLRQRAVIVSVRADEAATATVSGKVTIPHAKALVLAKLTRVLTADGVARFNLKLSRGALGAIKKALARRLKVTATITVVTADTAGNRTTRSRRIRLVR
jgi:hypothetical protein